MGIVKSHIDKNGRILNPSFLRKSLHLEVGGKIALYQEGSELKIMTFKDSFARARQIVKQFNKDNLDLVSLLL